MRDTHTCQSALSTYLILFGQNWTFTILLTLLLIRRIFKYPATRLRFQCRASSLSLEAINSCVNHTFYEINTIMLTFSTIHQIWRDSTYVSNRHFLERFLFSKSPRRISVYIMIVPSPYEVNSVCGILIPTNPHLTTYPNLFGPNWTFTTLLSQLLCSSYYFMMKPIISSYLKQKRHSEVMSIYYMEATFRQHFKYPATILGTIATPFAITTGKIVH